MTEKIIYKGLIHRREYRDNSDALFIGYASKPIAYQFQQDIYKKFITVRYWLSDTEKTLEELKENTLLSISGSLEANYSDRYSDYTGYLWTDEELVIGNHNILNELSSNIGKFIYIEVTVG